MYKLQYKNSEIGTVKEFDTLSECKWWFQTLCNIPENWNIVTPEGNVLDGKTYETW